MVVTRRWQQLEELFAQAIEQPKAARLGFITSATQDDPELRHELQYFAAVCRRADNIAGGFEQSPPGLEQSFVVVDEKDAGPGFGRHGQNAVSPVETIATVEIAPKTSCPVWDCASRRGCRHEL